MNINNYGNLIFYTFTFEFKICFFCFSNVFFIFGVITFPYFFYSFSLYICGIMVVLFILQHGYELLNIPFINVDLPADMHPTTRILIFSSGSIDIFVYSQKCNKIILFVDKYSIFKVVTFIKFVKTIS